MAQETNNNPIAASPKAFDVMAPGKTPPSPSAKPIIVSNRPMIKDPMAPNTLKSVSGALHPAAKSSGQGSSTLLPPTDKSDQAAGVPQLPGRRVMKSIPVLGGDNSDEPPAEVSQPEGSQDSGAPAEVPSTERSKTTAAKDNADDQSKSPAEADTPPDESEDSMASPDAPLADNEKQRLEKEQAEKKAEQEKIIASKQYYLPIKDEERQRGNERAVLWLVIALLAVLVWFDLVLDAGVIHIQGIHAFTHIFK